MSITQLVLLLCALAAVVIGLVKLVAGAIVLGLVLVVVGLVLLAGARGRLRL